MDDSVEQKMRELYIEMGIVVINSFILTIIWKCFEIRTSFLAEIDGDGWS